MGSALQARLAADAAVAPPDGGDAATVAWLRERARALGGPTFWVVPGLTAPDGRSDPLAGAAPDGVDPAAAALVVTQHAGVRPGVARLDRVLATVEILHGGPPAAVVHQQPVQPGERWVALAPAPGDRVPGGRVATLAFAPLPPVAGPVAVLVADEWVDVVPNRDETTSVAFHYDAPSSAAPNVVLLGVPRANAERWSTETVVQIVDEALALARLRTVDPDLLAGTAGQLLPGLYSREHETPGTVAGLQVAALTEPATPSEPPS